MFHDVISTLQAKLEVKAVSEEEIKRLAQKYIEDQDKLMKNNIVLAEKNLEEQQKEQQRKAKEYEKELEQRALDWKAKLEKETTERDAAGCERIRQANQEATDARLRLEEVERRAVEMAASVQTANTQMQAEARDWMNNQGEMMQDQATAAIQKAQQDTQAQAQNHVHRFQNVAKDIIDAMKEQGRGVCRSR